MPIALIIMAILALQTARSRQQGQAQVPIDFIPADEPLFEALEE